MNNQSRTVRSKAKQLNKAAGKSMQHNAMVFNSLDDIQLDNEDNSEAVKKVLAAGTRNNKMVQNQSSVERGGRGRSHLSNGRESAERRYNSLERYLKSRSNGNLSVNKHSSNNEYEKVKRGP